MNEFPALAFRGTDSMYKIPSCTTTPRTSSCRRVSALIGNPKGPCLQLITRHAHKIGGNDTACRAHRKFETDQKNSPMLSAPVACPGQAEIPRVAQTRASAF